jgi:ankyrin repeat protein
MDALIDAGAAVKPVPNNALVNGHFAAAEHAVQRGAPLTLAAALCLDRWDEAAQLVQTSTPEQKQFAFVLCALNGRAKALSWLLPHGVDINQPSPDLYSHGTPLHHAVSSGSLDAVKVLVEAGASPDIKDTAWSGTPLGWADYGERKEIADYLRSL